MPIISIASAMLLQTLAICPAPILPQLKKFLPIHSKIGLGSTHLRTGRIVLELMVISVSLVISNLTLLNLVPMFANNELRGEFRTCNENSASITPKTALAGLTAHNESKPAKPQKVKIKTSKSSNRIKNGKNSLSRERAKVVVVKDDDDTYHIIPKESININKQSCISYAFNRIIWISYHKMS